MKKLSSTAPSSAAAEVEIKTLSPAVQAYLFANDDELQRLRNQHRKYTDRIELAIETCYENHRTELEAYPTLNARCVILRRKLGYRLDRYGLNRKPSPRVVARVVSRLARKKD